MEEAELLRERLLAITDKRKLQEEISQRRLRIEEEKLKLHHLQKKSLREKWLLDGLSAMTPAEQEEMMRQNQEDRGQIQLLEQNITRLEQEIEDLEKQETQLSAKEVQVLQRLKSVERTTEDIIKAVKSEVRKGPEPVKDIYADIPDLPPSYRPSFIRRMESGQTEDGEEARRALFAMEIKVEKDLKTGRNTVLSSIPVPSDEITDAGVKVYDDGRKSVHAVSSGGTAVINGADSLAPVEVEDLLRKATERSTQSPTEYHQPVFSNAFHSVTTHQGQVSPGVNGHRSPLIMEHHNGQNFPEEMPRISPSVPEDSTSTQPKHVQHNGQENIMEPPKMSAPRESPFSCITADEAQYPAMEVEGDIHYNIVHATPCYLDDSEPITMIFMGYKNADEDERRPLTDYEGVIRAELVVIDDDEEENTAKQPIQTSPPIPTNRTQTSPPIPTNRTQTSPPTPTNHIQTSPPIPTNRTQTSPPIPTNRTQTSPPTPTNHSQTSPPIPANRTQTSPPIPTNHSQTSPPIPTNSIQTSPPIPNNSIQTSPPIPTNSTQTSSPIPANRTQTSSPIPANRTQTSSPIPTHKITLHSPQPYKNSISLQEQEATLGPHHYVPVSKQSLDDGTEDPSLTALRIRMAKLGKKVI